MDRCQGYFTRTPGLITTLQPMLAPNRRSRKTRTEEIGSNCNRRSGNPTKNHSATTKRPRPGEYQELLYDERSSSGMASSS